VDKTDGTTDEVVKKTDNEVVNPSPEEEELKEAARTAAAEARTAHQATTAALTALALATATSVADADADADAARLAVTGATSIQSLVH